MMVPPEVPPIPSAYGRTRSVTPSQMSGRITPSTPGAMMRRRTSMASSMSSSRDRGRERPTTPNLRSCSKQSFASSTSRQSHRSGFGGRGGGEIEELKRELDTIRKREEQTRTLLEEVSNQVERRWIDSSRRTGYLRNGRKDSKRSRTKSTRTKQHRWKLKKGDEQQ